MSGFHEAAAEVCGFVCTENVNTALGIGFTRAEKRDMNLDKREGEKSRAGWGWKNLIHLVCVLQNQIPNQEGFSVRPYSVKMQSTQGRCLSISVQGGICLTPSSPHLSIADRKGQGQPGLGLLSLLLEGSENPVWFSTRPILVGRTEFRGLRSKLHLP